LIIINKLQDIDNPHLFGLPMNIDRSVQRFNTSLVMEGMKKLATGGADDLKFDREKWSEMLGPIIKLWKSLFKQLTEKGLPKINEKQMSSDDPIESFVYTEAYNCYQIIDIVDQTIEGVSKVIYGSGLLTSEIQNEALELLVGNIPSKWTTIWEGATNPSSWLKGFAKRAYNLRGWLDMVKNGSLLSSELNLGDLYHPEIFLNAIRQKTSRKINCAIDSMKLRAAFDSSALRSPIVIKVKELLLQGCGFDGSKMIEPADDLPEFITLPLIYLAWNSSTEQEPYSENSTTIVPVYVSSSREKLLCKLKLPNTGSANDRTIGGVALLITDEE